MNAQALVNRLIEDDDLFSNPKEEVHRLATRTTYTLGGSSLIYAPGVIKMAQSEWRSGRKKQKAWAMGVVKSWEGLPEEVYRAILDGKVTITPDGHGAIVTVQ